MNLVNNMDRYEKALELARAYYDKDANAFLDTIFPELRENEDERIRKFLIDILSSGTWRKEWPFSPVDCVAYLEKQKEQENTSASTMIPSCWAKDPDKCPEFCVRSHCLGCPNYEQKKQKPELVQHPAISYMYNADAGRGEQIKQAILALLKSDLIQVAGRGFTKTELIEWVETRPAEIKEEQK